MATITGFTAARMLAMEAATVVSGDVVGDDLILTKHDGSTVDAGNVRGPVGPTGPPDDPVEDLHIVGDTGEPAFLNGWANYDDVHGSSPPHAPCAFYKDRKQVYLQGSVISGSGADIFVLPAGYHPQGRLQFPVMENGTITGAITVYEDGTVTQGLGGTTILSLNGINFRAA